MAKTALVTGITGQDGAYLAEFRLAKGYTVHGIKRRTSLINTDRVDHLYEEPTVVDRRLNLHHGDLTDSSCLVHVMQLVQPDEVYNLGAQSHVRVSFDQPLYTADVVGLGTLRLLEAARHLNRSQPVKFYQASSSEMYGAAPPPQGPSTIVAMVTPSACPVVPPGSGMLNIMTTKANAAKTEMRGTTRVSNTRLSRRRQRYHEARIPPYKAAQVDGLRYPSGMCMQRSRDDSNRGSGLRFTRCR